MCMAEAEASTLNPPSAPAPMVQPSPHTNKPVQQPKQKPVAAAPMTQPNPHIETPEQKHFLDVMAKFEGVKRHDGAEAHDKDTHGYGLKETTRNDLGIPMNKDPRVMAAKAYDHFYNKAKKNVKNLDSMDIEAKTFLTSTVWNTGTVFGSSKRIAEGKNFKLSDVEEYVNNIRTGEGKSAKYLAGLGNRRAKDYNVLAEGRGWPTIDKIAWTTKGGTFTFSNGKTAKINRKVEPTESPLVTLRSKPKTSREEFQAAFKAAKQKGAKIFEWPKGSGKKYSTKEA